MAKKRYKYAFAKQKHSAGGILSSVFAGISLLVLGGCAIVSLAFHGKGGIYLGAMGLASMCISVYGFVLGLKSFSEKNRDQLYCKIGSVGNGILMVIWLGLFLFGIS